MKKLLLILSLVASSLYSHKSSIEGERDNALDRKEFFEKMADKKVSNTKIKCIRSRAQELFSKDPALALVLGDVETYGRGDFKTKEDIIKAADFWENKFPILVKAGMSLKGECLKRQAEKEDESEYDKIMPYCDAQVHQFIAEIANVVLEEMGKKEKQAAIQESPRQSEQK